MDWDYLIQHTLLRIAFLSLILGVSIRIVFFFIAVIKVNPGVELKWRHLLTNFGRIFIPLHMLIPHKPLYVITRYIFHSCLVVIPIWSAGHVYLWEEYGFNWYWTPLPDGWSEALTLAVLILAGLFLIRRIFVRKIRCNSSPSDFILIAVAALPFLTGYIYTRGTMDFVPFFANHLQNIHILAAEVMMVMVAFLFCTTRLTMQHCTGCKSCALSCPTRALASVDEGNRRIFSYALYQCVSCGLCLNTCPEAAVKLGHEISLKRFLQLAAKPLIHSVELAACHKCGAFFAPELQIDKLGSEISDNYIYICPKCKQRETARKLWLKS
jgi:Pyruvate/2-oxoacid:ferredoxin oxidoreductase delta subunit